VSTVEVTGTAQRAAWNQGEIPEVERVREGVWSIPVPMPGNPLRYSYCYAFLDGARALVVDPGWPADQAWDVLAAGLAAIGSSVDDVDGILVSHAHHDHYGLAPRLHRVSGAWVALGADGVPLLLPDATDPEAVLEDRRRWLMREGGVADAEASRGAGERAAVEVTLVSHLPDRHLVGGEVIDFGRFRIEAVTTPCHSPGHMVFRETTEKLLLSGDHILPRITPNVSAYVGHGRTTLHDYLASLDRVDRLDVDEVLPGHEWRFAGLSERIREIREHHEERLAEMADHLEDEMSAWELSQRLSWARPWEDLSPFGRRAALGETLAHLHLLATRKRAQLVEDDRGWRWRPDGRGR
jgi:glyoxylase-like metal-dependent hydrolase (beta-lactamase superfamily II)